MQMPNGREGAVHTEGENTEAEGMKKMLEKERKRLEEFVDELENDVNNRSYEDELAEDDKMYVQGQISASEDFLDFLEEVLKKGEKNGRKDEV